MIIINAIIWVAEITFGEPFINTFSLHYYKSPDFGVWQILTHMFLHAPLPNFFHILFNMFGLWMFGSVLENLWGSKRFLIFYLICGIGAGLIHALSSVVELNILMERFVNEKISEAEYQAKGSAIFYGIALGASGAIMGVFAAFAYLFPNTTLLILPIPFPIKVKYWIAGLILLDLFGGINPRFGGGVAHFAHLGGALFGFILVKTMNRNNRKTFY